MSSPSSRPELPADDAAAAGPGATIGAGLRIARAEDPRLLGVLLATQLVEAVALVAAVLATQRCTALLLHQAPVGRLAGPGAGLALALAVAGACQAVQPALAQVLGERLAGATVTNVLRVAGCVPLDDLDRPAVLDRLKRVEAGSLVRPAQLAVGLGIVLSGSVGAVALAVAVLAIQPWLAAVAVAAAVPLWWAARRDAARGYQSVRGLSAVERRRFYLAGLLTRRESAAEVRASQLTDVLVDRYRAACAQRFAEVRRTAAERARRQLIARGLGAVTSGAGLAVLLTLVSAGRITVAEAVTAVGAVAALRGRLADLATGVRQLQEAAEFVADYAEVLGSAPHRPDAVERPPAPRLRTLTLTGVSLTYPGAARPALAGVDLDLRAGEVVALVGANGSGKSTLAAVAAGLRQPTAGTVLWNGRPLPDVPGGWREQVALLPQSPVRFQDSLRDNVRFGRSRREDDAAIRAALDRAGADFAAAVPLDDLVGAEQNGGRELSGGQWQRLALARTFYRDGRLLILDEPSAPLDPIAEKDLITRLRGEFPDRAVLLVTHRMAAARSADRVVVLHRGRVAEAGPPATLLAQDGMFAAMTAAQDELWAPPATAARR